MRTARSPIALSFALVIASLVAMSTSALASGVAVVVGGDADQETRRALATAVERSLKDKREETHQLNLDAREIDALVDCVSREASKECAAAFMRSRSSGASRAIVLSVGRDARAKKTTITGWIVAQDGTVLVIDQGVCDACTATALKNVTMELLSALLREVEARTMPTTLAIRTTPPGAQVEIDGRIVGETNDRKPFEYRVYAGPHRVVVQLRGYETASRSVQLVPGETKPVDIVLVPLPGSAKPPRPPETKTPDTTTERHQVRWGGWITLGSGVVVASTGIGLVIADQGTPDPASGQHSQEHRDTMTLGLAATGLGAAAIGAGIWWLLRDTGEPRGRARATPGVRVEPGSAILLYTGTF
jgi:hypothetical protein